MKSEETTRFEERYREFERQVMQEEDATAAACKHTEDEPAAISEHVDELNETTATADTRKDEAANKTHAEKCDEATAAADKGRNEATAAAAKMKSSKKDILRSQSNENCKSEEEDEEIMALIHERKKINKDDKERLKEVSKNINKCIRDKKKSSRLEKIQRIVEEFKGIRSISSIKSAKKGHSSQKKIKRRSNHVKKRNCRCL